MFGEAIKQPGMVGKAGATVRALTYCDLHKIGRADLMEVLAMYPEFSEKFWKNLKITYDLCDDDSDPVHVEESVMRTAESFRVHYEPSIKYDQPELLRPHSTQSNPPPELQMNNTNERLTKMEGRLDR